MNKATIVLALVMLTSLDGSPVWVESTQVIIIRPHIASCSAGTGAAIRVGPRGLCVREKPEEIMEKMKNAR